MSDDSTYRWQFSDKFGPSNAAMLNIRADSAEEFAVMLADDLPKLRDALRNAASILADIPVPAVGIGDVRAVPPPVYAPAPASVPTPAVITAAPVPPPKGQEIGPVVIEKIEVTRGTSKTGKPYVRHVVHFQGGIKASTFDTLLADVANQLVSRPAFAMVEKTEKFGYELIGLRPAA